MRSTNIPNITVYANQSEYINRLRELLPVSYNYRSKVRIYNIKRYEND